MDLYFIRSKNIAAFYKSNITPFIVLQDEQKKMLALFIVRTNALVLTPCWNTYHFGNSFFESIQLSALIILVFTIF